ncbi:trypsin-like serine peptidase [Frigidibacter sp. MR17.24]|uniref:trypsin-like serine peptidase n=1 Tax=Frigidibacter sp. MR17.24 TaxID=3127345 RepID=UPI003012D914
MPAALPAWVLALGLAVMLAGAARAQDPREDPERFQAAQPVPPGGMARWPAVGRLARTLAPDPDEMICTATLVAPDLVITAGHCLPRSGSPSVARRRLFAAGYQDGAAAAVSAGRYVVQSTLASDPVTGLALLRLATPLPADTVAPMPLAAPPEGITPFTIIAYRNSDRARPVALPGCPGRITGPTTVQVDCPVVSGNSGAPLLVETAAGPALVAVITAHTRGGPRRQALATRIPGDLLRLIAEDRAAALPPP